MENLITSNVTNDVVPSHENLAKFILKQIDHRLTGNVYLVAYQHHIIRIGRIRNTQIDIENDQELKPEFLKELRMFSENGELYVWKQQQQLKYRLRIDNETKGDVYIYPEAHFMWGNRLDENDPCTVFEENRGMRLKLPFDLTNIPLPLKYEVRNYYTFDDDGLIRFYDARLVKFLDKEGNPLAGNK